MGDAINLVENFKVKNVFNCSTYNDLDKELIKKLD